jgi:intein/homing endonuclease
MSSGIFITLAGILCILFGLFYSKNSTLRVAVGIIGAILLIYGGYTYGNIEPMPHIETFDTGNKLQVTYPIEKVQVLSPVEGDSVKCRILTLGVYPESHTKDIWVLLKPSDDKYYPQSDNTNTSFKLNGEWQVVTRFGGDKGEAYELIVYETDEAASAFFSETIAEWKSNNDYVGLELQEIPSGATEIDRISVSLKDNCRGVF